MGEYELVLRLAQPYLDSHKQLELLAENTEQLPVIWADIVLSVALAYLELGREQWQLKEYESAAKYQQEGYNLLVQQDLFNNLQKEIETELYKLRPYRIIALLEKQDNQVSQRQKGLNLLQEMLDERNGIEGKGIDKSGLNLDYFLRFLQQIRVYLNVAEQQQLFEDEAKRPSPAAGYLAFYALLARGFAERNPTFIVRAKNILFSLSDRQDVYLEQAICALLLGQTEEAEFALGQSQETEAISYIKEHSQNSPDLLPGLCSYSEKWLQTEVFSQFRDLNNQPSSLKEYFADEDVQTYLEKLYLPSFSNTDESLISINEFWDHESFNQDSSQNSQEIKLSQHGLASLSSSDYNGESLGSKHLELSQKNDDYLALENNNISDVNVLSLEKSKRKSQSSFTEKNQSGSHPSRPISYPKKNTNSRFTQLAKSKLFWLLIILGLGLIVALVIYNSIFNKKEEELILLIGQQPFEIPAESLDNPQTIFPTSLDPQRALKLVQNWLEAKEKATGQEYKIDEFNKVLSEPLLSRWRSNAQSLQKINAYRLYQHKLAIESTQINSQNPNKAVIIAKVKEVSQYYQNGVLNPSQSYDDNLVVRYALIRENNQWFIKDIEVLN